MVLYSGRELYCKIDNLLLTSCQQLRSLIRLRWKKETGKEWIDGKEQGAEFIRKYVHIYTQFEPKGKQGKKTLQQEMIEGGLLDTWDLTQLSSVLQKFGDANENQNENEAIKTLTSLRNKLAHHPNKELSEEEFSANLDIVRSNMQAIGLSENDIEKLIETVGITSSEEALESVKKLYKKAENYEKDGNFEAAVNCYEEATEMPSLLPEHQGVAYENKATCYLKRLKEVTGAIISSKERNILQQQAMLDAKEALEENEHSWKAHYLVAQCHQLENKLDDAIRHYQRALSISPVQTQVKRDLDICKEISTSRKRHDHLNPNIMPLNLTERVAHHEKMTGMRTTDEQFLALNSGEGPMYHGEDHVFKGHQYKGGWGVSQDYKEAARYFEKATQVRNPEGIYNLGCLYMDGKGVDKNLHKAFQYFKEAAEMSANTRGQKSPFGKNVGVAAAQHTLGLMYKDGIFVEQDYAQALMWYSKASDNGIGNASNNLALMYRDGEGVERNEKMAEMYWYHGAILKDVNAVAALMNYYVGHLEPERALALYHAGKSLGHSGILNMKKEDLDSMLLTAKHWREQTEAELLEFEKEQNLNKKGLTYSERLQRQVSHRDEHAKKLLQTMKKLGSGQSWGGKIYPEKLNDPKVITCLEERAVLGSTAATNLLETLRCASEAFKIITSQKYTTEENELKLLELLYRCATLDIHALPHGLVQKLKIIVLWLFEKCDGKGDFEMKARFCFVSYNMAETVKSADMFSVELLKEGIRRYPNNHHYFQLLSDFLRLKNDFKSALHYTNEGLKLVPDHIWLLYQKAVCSRDLASNSFSGDTGETIAAFEEFLEMAPTDHRKVPDACYTLAFEYLRKPTGNKVENRQKMKDFFNKGLKAEKDQLPCYLPYQSSDRKTMLENVILLSDSMEARMQEEKEHKLVPLLERKPYLRDPLRKVLLLEHREKIRHSCCKDGARFHTSLAPRLEQTISGRKVSELKPVTLKEMNPTCDHIYEDCKLELTVIEDACLGLPSIHLLAEDENGDVTRLYLYNVEQNRDSQEKYGFGSRLTIINPYMRISGHNFSNGIRNDEPKCVVVLEKGANMCRFCGEEGAPRKCSKCERSYCSRKCQKLDWKMFEHKLICEHKVASLRVVPLSIAEPLIIDYKNIDINKVCDMIQEANSIS